MANSESKGRVLRKAKESLSNKVMPEVNFEELTVVIQVPKVEKGILDRRYSHVQSHGGTLRNGKWMRMENNESK